MSALVARTRRERVRGLLSHVRLDVDDGLLLPGATSVHTFGMRFPIRVVLLDATLSALQVLDVVPRRLVFPRPSVRHVLECSSLADVRPGDRFVVRRSRPGLSSP